MAQNYILQVTAGTEYDTKTHQIVAVNSATPTAIESEHISASLNVRIQSYRGLPHSSPDTSPYFDLPPHSKSKDAYSISFSFSPKSNINGNDLVFGNDFDHPIRDRLPPGFSTAFKIVKWVVDPGLDGDVYADKPYLYGPAGSSVNALWVGDTKESVKGYSGEGEDEETGKVWLEGGSEEGLKEREEKGVPESDAARKKWFLNETHRKTWEWEAGRWYGADFYNPYLDFNDFALRLPGFTLPIMKYWDGQGLRYVLKDRNTDRLLFAITFTLYLKEDVDEKGNVKEGVEAGVPIELMSKEGREKHEKMVDDEVGVEDHHNDAAEENKKPAAAPPPVAETNDDDVD